MSFATGSINNMFPSEAEKKRVEIMRKMPAEKRLKITFELNNIVRKIMEAGIRNQHPKISLEEFNREIAHRIEL